MRVLFVVAAAMAEFAERFLPTVLPGMTLCFTILAKRIPFVRALRLSRLTLRCAVLLLRGRATAGVVCGVICVVAEQMRHVSSVAVVVQTCGCGLAQEMLEDCGRESVWL